MKYLIFLLFMIFSPKKEEEIIIARIDILNIDGKIFFRTIYDNSIYSSLCDVHMQIAYNALQNCVEIDTVKQDSKLKKL